LRFGCQLCSDAGASCWTFVIKLRPLQRDPTDFLL